MNKSESYLLNILKRTSGNGKWKFFEVFDKNGKTLPQAKNYGEGFVSYPDFELYCEQKLMLLVEVKGYNGFFDGETGMLAMKYKCYKGYKRVRAEEDVDVKICFVISFDSSKPIVFWESIENISGLKSFVKRRKYREYDYKSKEVVEKEDDFIYWYAEEFRTDEDNISSV